MVMSGESPDQDTADRPGELTAGVQPYYAHHAGSLAERYESVSFEAVHGDVLDLLPPPPARAADIGAGTGRDAAALARRGYDVLAVEPVPELRQVAQRLHPIPSVSWTEGSLPELRSLSGPLDLILLSAVWMHLAPADRSPAMGRLAGLLAPSGILVISLRRGEPPTDRVMYDVPAEEVVSLGETAGLHIVRVAENDTDSLGRDAIWWQSVVLRREAQ
ncbi:class I SAM-dependent methyltransferase [Streptomyces abyssomicinicus]|uniref:class I SAM-dependent methyltransferase n=1 Tax=Streptomyces abyssomicinicus TaxID=574929 RepID=UPI001FE4AC58|nr:class I SAM-dependent methyltransferase [Streptomyces abyssomicinicus]